MADPRDALVVLDRLEELGFDDAAFSVLHRAEEARPPITISSYRARCLEGGGGNEQTERRLRLVLYAYLLGGFTSRNERVFVALAQAACAELPSANSSNTANNLAPRTGRSKAYMINVDLEIQNEYGGQSECGSRMHKDFGGHFDLTIHSTTCGKRNSRSANRKRRYWDDNKGKGYTFTDVVKMVREIQKQNSNAHPRRCSSCDVEAHPPDWD